MENASGEMHNHVRREEPICILGALAPLREMRFIVRAPGETMRLFAISVNKYLIAYNIVVGIVI